MSISPHEPETLGVPEMKTKLLMEFLAHSPTAVDPYQVRNRFAHGISLGVLSWILLIIVLLGVRLDIHAAVFTIVFWAKLGFSFSMVIGGVIVVSRLARPEEAVNEAWFGIVVPWVFVALASAIALYHSPHGTVWSLVSDRLWRRCPLDIAALSLIGLGVMLHAKKSLAPTHLTLAGAVGGLVAGATAAFTHCLRCPEMNSCDSMRTTVTIVTGVSE